MLSEPRLTKARSTQSPPASQRRPLRYSLISAAQAVTPSKSSASSSIFGGLLSPFRTAPAPVEAELAQPESDDEVDELMSWDEQPEEGVDGIGADLISWDEQDVAATEEAAENELPVDASVAAGTPSSAKGQFTMASTPALSQRVRESCAWHLSQLCGTDFRARSSGSLASRTHLRNPSPDHLDSHHSHLPVSSPLAADDYRAS